MKNLQIKKLTSVICIVCMILMVYAYTKSNDPMYLAIAILVGLSASLQIYIGYIDELLHSYMAFNEKVTNTLMSNQLNLIKTNLNILNALCDHEILDKEEVDTLSETRINPSTAFDGIVKYIHKTENNEKTDD